MKTQDKILALGIHDEHEDGTLWFDVQDVTMLMSYITNNIERGEVKKFELKEFTESEFLALGE